MSKSELAAQVMELYRQIDNQTHQLKAATGLECPVGCGKCCENPEIDATPLEMLPLAIELYQRGEAAAWWEQVTLLNGQGTCVFYQPDPLIPGNGRCSVYPWRPAVCRLFALATVKSKQGKPELAACARHKETLPTLVERAKEAIAAGLPAPSFSEWAVQLAHLDPSRGSQRLPINQALKEAIEQVGLLTQLARE